MGKHLPFLGVIVCGLVVIVTTALGAHIYRWEALVWQVVAVVMAACAWTFSRLSDD